MFDRLDRNEHMIFRDTGLEEAVRSAIIQMNKMADDYLRDYLTARGIILATPEHDAAVAAKALREVVEIFDGDCIDLAEELRWTTDAPKGWSDGSVALAIEATLLFGPWLTARADRIERGAGESDADT